MQFHWLSKLTGLWRRRGFHRLRAAHLRLGRQGERLARRALSECGMEYLAQNWRSRKGELDLIFRDGEVLCFVEVKTRHRQILWEPADAVNAAKRKMLIQTAEAYRKAIGAPNIAHRFDIVEVIFDGRHLAEMRHWVNAFQEPPKRRWIG